ncbi:hypothetical protein J6500_08355 [Bradyrhizobium sp. WSM 1704]|nr:hypothetical protein [Bradyrhizobium semiaridum]MCA6121910.1 hypothetical protein [Bradyrhizobium semiaridum]
MARFDDYLSFDPSLFEPGGGLYGRLASMLAEQGFYQPVQGSPFRLSPQG